MHETQRRTSAVTTCDGRPADTTGIPAGREDPLPSRRHSAPYSPDAPAEPCQAIQSFLHLHRKRGLTRQKDQMAVLGLHGKVTTAHC